LVMWAKLTIHLHLVLFKNICLSTETNFNFTGLRNQTVRAEFCLLKWHHVNRTNTGQFCRIRVKMYAPTKQAFFQMRSFLYYFHLLQIQSIVRKQSAPWTSLHMKGMNKCFLFV
jgi:hypothetical protein